MNCACDWRWLAIFWKDNGFYVVDQSKYATPNVPAAFFIGDVGGRVGVVVVGRLDQRSPIPRPRVTTPADVRLKGQKIEFLPVSQKRLSTHSYQYQVGTKQTVPQPHHCRRPLPKAVEHRRCRRLLPR